MIQLHLATCTANIPHVSLMNYTYLPAHPFRRGRLPPGPVIIMTSNSSSKKTINLQSNPNVSLLVHDWVSTRPPNASGGRERSPVGARTQRSSLANMLMQMNSTAVSNISTTINGEATVLESGSDEERWCKEQHLVNNTFEDEGAQGLFRTSSEEDPASEAARNSLIEDQQARVVVVRIRDGRISDWKGGIKDWVVTEADSGEAPIVNGVVNH